MVYLGSLLLSVLCALLPSSSSMWLKYVPGYPVLRGVVLVASQCLSDALTVHATIRLVIPCYEKLVSVRQCVQPCVERCHFAPHAKRVRCRTRREVARVNEHIPCIPCHRAL